MVIKSEPEAGAILGGVEKGILNPVKIPLLVVLGIKLL
jgi:hypothetical protein